MGTAREIVICHSAHCELCLTTHSISLVFVDQAHDDGGIRYATRADSIHSVYSTTVSGRPSMEWPSLLRMRYVGMSLWFVVYLSQRTTGRWLEHVGSLCRGRCSHWCIELSNLEISSCGQIWYFGTPQFPGPPQLGYSELFTNDCSRIVPVLVHFHGNFPPVPDAHSVAERRILRRAQLLSRLRTMVGCGLLLGLLGISMDCGRDYHLFPT